MFPPRLLAIVIPLPTRFRSIYTVPNESDPRRRRRRRLAPPRSSFSLGRFTAPRLSRSCLSRDCTPSFIPCPVSRKDSLSDFPSIRSSTVFNPVSIIVSRTLRPISFIVSLFFAAVHARFPTRPTPLPTDFNPRPKLLKNPAPRLPPSAPLTQIGRCVAAARRTTMTIVPRKCRIKNLFSSHLTTSLYRSIVFILFFFFCRTLSTTTVEAPDKMGTSRVRVSSCKTIRNRPIE